MFLLLFILCCGLFIFFHFFFFSFFVSFIFVVCMLVSQDLLRAPVPSSAGRLPGKEGKGKGFYREKQSEEILS